MKVLIFAVLIVLVFSLLALLPAITIDVDAVTQSSAWDWIIAAMYFIPTGTCTAILTILVALWSFQLVIALVKMVWDLLPVA